MLAVSRLVRYTERWHILINQHLCRHQWRAGVRGDRHPYRLCSKCEKLEKMTEGEFYAHFGRMPRS